MKQLTYPFIVLLWMTNAVTAVLLLLTAYSPYIQPTAHPLASTLGLLFPVFVLANGGFVVLWLALRQFKHMWLSVAAMLFCFGPLQNYCPLNPRTDPLPEGCLKLLSYNVMGFHGSLDEKEKPNPILTYLQTSGADILCLQEYATSRWGVRQSAVEEALKAYPYHRINIVGDQKKGGNNRLACYSKFPILSARVIDYESEYNGSVLYEILIGNDTLTLINNHLESNKLTLEDRAVYVDMLKDPEKEKVKNGARLLLGKLAEASALRAPQADAVAHELASTPHPFAIACGDFNDTPISYAHRVIATDMDDAFATSGRGLGISYNQNRFYFRIDHILVSKNLKAYNCTVDRSIKHSDHYPIWCHIGKRNS